jgi:hypothetical protein
MDIKLDNIAARLGSGLGAGIGQHIDQNINELAQHKMMQLQSRNVLMQKNAERAQQRENLVRAGTDPRFADFILAHDPAVQKTIFENAPQVAQMLGLPSFYTGGQQNPLAQNNYQPQGQPSWANKNVDEMTPRELAEASGMVNHENGGFAGGQQGMVGGQQGRPAGGQQVNPYLPFEKRLKQEANEYQRRGVEAREKALTHTINQDKKKESKDVRDYLEKFEEKGSAAKRNIEDYSQLANLARSGELNSGKTRQLLSKLGLDFLTNNYKTELAQKLMARLAQNVGTAFKGNVTNFLEQTYQKSLPSLWNSPENIVAISELNTIADTINNIIPLEARRAIIKENGGQIPQDIEEQIEQRIQPQVKKLQDQALGIMMKTVFDSTNKKPVAVGDFVEGLEQAMYEAKRLGKQYIEDEQGRKIKVR